VVQGLEWPAWVAFLGRDGDDADLVLCARSASAFEALRARGRLRLMFVFVFTFMVSSFVAYLAALIFGTWPQTIFPTIFWPVTLVGKHRGERLGSARRSVRPAAVAGGRSLPSCASRVTGQFHDRRRRQSGSRRALWQSTSAAIFPGHDVDRRPPSSGSACFSTARGAQVAAREPACS